MNVGRLLGVNAVIRMAAAGTGQLFAFLLVERMTDRADVGALVVGLLAAAFFATEIVGAPLAGHVADRIGPRRVLGYAPLFGIVSALIAAIAAAANLNTTLLVGILLAARLNEGASAAAAVPTTLVLLARGTEGDPRRRTRIMGAFEITSLIGMLLGFAAAGIAWDAMGPAAFFLVAPLYTAAWILVQGRAVAPQRMPARTPSPFRTLARIWRRPDALGFGVAWLAINAVVGVWIQQAPFLLKLPEGSTEQVLVGGFSGRQIGLIFGVWGAAFLTGLVLWSTFGSGWPRRRTMVASSIGMLGVVASIAMVNHGGPTWVLWITAVLVMVESGFTPAAFSWLADLTSAMDASRGVTLGLYSLILGMGQLAGSVIGAPFAARWQLDGVLGLTAILAVIALAGVLRLPAQTTTS